jgi:hypothetical protein
VPFRGEIEEEEREGEERGRERERREGGIQSLLFTREKD